MMKNKKLGVFVVLLVVFMSLFLVADVYARAGGGGSYSGGSGGGGSSSGGGGDGGGGLALYFIIRAWISFCIAHPFLGIPLTIVAVVLFFKFGGKIKLQQQGRTIVRGRQVQEQAQRNAAIQNIQQRDPQFNVDRLYSRIEKAFVVLQEAWSQQDLSAARAFISDGIIERFSLQFKEQKEKGYRNRMDQLNVHEVIIAQVDSDEVFDTVSVKITASAVDYNESLKDGRRLSGSTVPSTFTEYWSFVRRPGAKSLGGDGLIEGNCPNCAAQLKLNETEKCSSCGAVVKSGEYDWVLTEITQACEWVVSEMKTIPGAAALRENDPGFSVQNLEDRTSVVFWRFSTALREGRVDAIRKMALPACCNELQEQMNPDEQGRRTYYEDCAVGSVDTEGVLHGEEVDRAVMGVRWSGALFSISSDGAPKQENASHVVYDLFVLARKHGVKTDVGLALSSAHCPSCGSAIHNQAVDACEYCGAVLNDGSSGWVLEKILKVHSKEAGQLREQIRALDPVLQNKRARSSLEQVAWMIQVMLADGQVDENEKQALSDFAQKHHIPAQKVDQMIAAMKAGQLSVPEPQNVDEASEWLELMAEMVLADGKITPQEKQAMLNMAGKLQFTEADINVIINRKRTELYQSGRAGIKAHKNKGES